MRVSFIFKSFIKVLSIYSRWPHRSQRHVVYSEFCICHHIHFRAPLTPPEISFTPLSHHSLISQANSKAVRLYKAIYHEQVHVWLHKWNHAVLCPLLLVSVIGYNNNGAFIPPPPPLWHTPHFLHG